MVLTPPILAKKSDVRSPFRTRNREKRPSRAVSVSDCCILPRNQVLPPQRKAELLSLRSKCAFYIRYRKTSKYFVMVRSGELHRYCTALR